MQEAERTRAVVCPRGLHQPFDWPSREKRMTGFRLAVAEARFREPFFFVAGFGEAFPLSAELVFFTVASPRGKSIAQRGRAASYGPKFQISTTHFHSPPGRRRHTATARPAPVMRVPSGPGTVREFVPVVYPSVPSALNDA